MTDEEGAHGGGLGWLARMGLIVGIPLVLYLVSAGPAFALLTAADIAPSSTAGEVCETVMRPHLWAAAHSEAYFDYLVWWVFEVGGETGPSTSWEQFRQHYG